ncbi:hypothetical protein COT49_02590 [candidate division WWE3 bacterium CG08_land_8_20_14_0_20_40_13]|uniref:UDP-N-acetylmuramoyl-tripeptide--D-alanyl-D-alanine ligase n=1 Tax=candidate division WWE3 bacterium CG08_land_8_20_14_0_20_40_13 TaxID=1975084 RepID=A0A2H0XDF6_UNCKA|nr:MAG: hypothetical protein COT49_02590 [candidate division WWE3 bacterium CG08_land_8_20_14_0_20_40_13]
MNLISYILILQLEDYQIRRFLKWVLKNPFGKALEGKKPLVWTYKAKFIAVCAGFWYLIIILGLFEVLGIFGLLFGLFLAFFPWIFVVFALVTRRPYEAINRKLAISKTRKIILHLKSKGLKVIGITGSYGKTTTKEFLYQILKDNYKVLRTPESYNTLFGIKNVIDLELDESYDFFICEMGAYKTGEIKELCKMAQPDYAILTGINEQHLERFGKIENTIKAKFELIQAVTDKTRCLLNHDCELITSSYLPYVSNSPNQLEPVFYSFEDINITNFSLIGTANITNAIAAATMAKIIGLTQTSIDKKLTELKPFSHRLEVKILDNGWTILDDSYNSNVDGFKLALSALKGFKGIKIIATPGIVELGSKTKEIHRELGKLCDEMCDYIILVGKNERTIALAEGITTKFKIIYMESIKLLNKTVESLNIKSPVILIENDLTDNY